MMSGEKNIIVLGAGAWGTALAEVLCQPGHAVTLWSRSEAQARSTNETHENQRYLPGVPLNPRINATHDIAHAANADVIFSVAPAQHTREVLSRLPGHIGSQTPIVLCSKGIEVSTEMLMSDVLRAVVPEAVPAVLSGPSFAADVARGLPTAVTLAAEERAIGEEIIAAISTPAFRPYLSHDIAGVEVGGAVKNVLAIACGITLGKGLGRSAHAALISRGAAEMTRLAIALGGRAETLSGLSGLGDLVLTCSSETSRNMSCGLALGRGQSLEEIMGERTAVTEGVATAPVLKKLASRLGVEMPISEAVADIVATRASVDEAIMRLLNRPTKVEVEAR